MSSLEMQKGADPPLPAPVAMGDPGRVAWERPSCRVACTALSPSPLHCPTFHPRSGGFYERPAGLHTWGASAGMLSAGTWRLMLRPAASSPPGRLEPSLALLSPSLGSPAREWSRCFPFPQVHRHLFVLRLVHFPSSGLSDMPRLPGRLGTRVDVEARWFPGRVQAPRAPCSEGRMGQSWQFKTPVGPWLLCGGERGTQALGMALGPGGMVQLLREGREKE